MARILFLSQLLPFPLDAGPKVRSYHMLRHLALRHQVTLVAFSRPDDRPEHVAAMESFCSDVHVVPMRRSLWRNFRAVGRALVSGLPAVIVRDEVAEMRDLVRGLVSSADFDAIHADQLSMARYGLLAAGASRNRSVRTLLDEHNAIHILAQRMAADESNGLRRIAMRREARAFSRYEADVLRAYDWILTVTDEDAGHLASLFADGEVVSLRQKMQTVPICVAPEVTETVPRSPDGPPTILHLGTMFWPPNVQGVLWFAREVLPLVRAEMPQVRFLIVGKNPPPEVGALARDPSIEVTGYVPDPAPYLARSDVFVVPLAAGGGMRVKILDAWLWGVPVVSTPLGAEGIQVADGQNILLAQSPVAFAAAVIRLLTDATLNRNLRSAGRAWVEASYGWQEVYSVVDQVYERLLA